MNRHPELELATADQLKRVALRLFGERGIEDVTLREIATAAGQKNHAAIFYYFGSKEDLVLQLLREGATIVNDRHHRTLDELEAGGKPLEIRDIVQILIFAHADVHGGPGEDTFSRFFQQAMTTHREWVRRANADELNSGYRRCLDHLRKLMPSMSVELEMQRFVFLGVCLRGVLAARESALSDVSRDHPTWNSELMLAHFAETLTAMLASEPPAGVKGSSERYDTSAAAKQARIPRSKRRLRRAGASRRLS
jgi:AcrR family transcriptional regulator